MAMTTIAYKDGGGASKTALAGSNGTDTSTGVTLCDASGVNITTLPVSVATLPALTTGAAVIGAVTQSGTWTAATNADGTIAAGTAPAKAHTAGLIYNSSPITLTTTQGSALQGDVNGYLKVSVPTLPALTTGAAVIGAVTQSGTWTAATNADGTIAAGTAPAKALVGGLVYNSSPITLTTGQASAIQADANGYLKVSVAASITQPVSIAALPALTTGAAVIGAVTQSGTWTAATNADGTIAAGTAPAKALTAGLIYNSSPITLTTGQGAALQSDANGYLKVSIVAAPTVQTVGGTSVLPTATLTRPANTTAYAISDVFRDTSTNPLSWSNAVRVSGGTGVVLGARLIKNNTTTTGASFRLWLFAATTGALTDNAAYSLTYAARTNRLGYIDFPSAVVGSDCCEFAGSIGQGSPLMINCAATTLFGDLQILGVYTPTSGELLEIELQIVQD